MGKTRTVERGPKPKISKYAAKQRNGRGMSALPQNTAPADLPEVPEPIPQVLSPAPATVGVDKWVKTKIKWYRSDRGYGFLENPSSQTWDVHFTKKTALRGGIHEDQLMVGLDVWAIVGTVDRGSKGMGYKATAVALERKSELG